MGWEIDIDEDSLARYFRIPGMLGEHLRENIDVSDSGACFRLTPEERCPFLDERGLCELIIELGEESLCQICDDHPRFRNFFSDREEVGLGLCCEAAAKRILGRNEAFRLRVIEDDGEPDSLDEDEAELIELREELFGIAGDRRFSIGERMERMLAFCGMELPGMDIPRWAAFLRTLERLDEAWGERLRAVACMGCSGDFYPAELRIAFEQMLSYLLFRHLPGALEDGDIAGRVGFTVLSVRMVSALLEASGESSFEELAEICRMYSSRAAMIAI